MTTTETTVNDVDMGSQQGVTIDDAIRHCGGLRKWQYKSVILFQGIMSSGSFALYPMTYYELQPAYLCKRGAEWESCEPVDFCTDETVQYKVDTDNALSLHNWVTDYNMTCSPKYHFGLFGSLFFIAVVLSSLLFPPLADKYGRKIVCLMGIGAACIA